MSDMPPVAPSTPDPELSELIFGILRHVLSGLGAVGITFGAVSDSNISIASGCIAWIIAAIWSYYNKKRLKEEDHLGSVLSAKLGKPVQPL